MSLGGCPWQRRQPLSSNQELMERVHGALVIAILISRLATSLAHAMTIVVAGDQLDFERTCHLSRLRWGRRQFVAQPANKNGYLANLSGWKYAGRLPAERAFSSEITANSIVWLLRLLVLKAVSRR
jgi:hypothetical protein